MTRTFSHRVECVFLTLDEQWWQRKLRGKLTAKQKRSELLKEKT